MVRLATFLLLFLASTFGFAYTATAYTNIQFDSAGQQLDLYTPVPLGHIGPKSPAIVFIHGGGWISGEKEDMDALANYYADLGYVTVSINYRLAPTYVWPTQIDDCQAAVRWVRKYAGVLSVDPSHIAAYGVSAGGHLVNAMISRDTIDNFDPALSGYSSRVEAGVDYLGPSDFTDPSIWNPTVWGWIEEMVGQTWNGNVAPFEAASPAYMVNGNTAPLIIFASQSDPIVPIAQSREMANVLTEADRAEELFVFEGDGHGFHSWEYEVCIYEEGLFLSKYLPIH